jgi:hypothetical protein
LEELLKRLITELDSVLRVENQYRYRAIPQELKKIRAQMFRGDGKRSAGRRDERRWVALQVETASLFRKIHRL